MTAFRFRAVRADGALIDGTVQAGSLTLALHQIESRGLFAIDVDAVAEAATTARPSLELATALQGLGALLAAGLPADRALAAVGESAPARLAVLLGRARERVTQGESLALALEQSHAVTPSAAASIRAGEKSGRLAEAVTRAGTDMETAVELRGRIRAALTYPTFLALAGSISVAAITVFIIPRFAALLDAASRDLPASTKLLLVISGFAGRYWLPLLGMALVAAALLHRFAQTGGGRVQLDGWLLSLPAIGSLRLQLASSRICAALANLLAAGVPMLAALAHARASAGNGAIEQRLGAAAEEVERGERLGVALEHHRALDELSVRLIHFGEQSGNLPAFLSQASRLGAMHAQQRLQRLATLLEPALILGFGGAVAFVALAVFQAIYAVRPS